MTIVKVVEPPAHTYGCEKMNRAGLCSWSGQSSRAISHSGTYEKFGTCVDKFLKYQFWVSLKNKWSCPTAWFLIEMTLVACFKYVFDIANTVSIFTVLRVNLQGQICWLNTPSGYNALMGYITRAMNYPLKVYNTSNQHTKDFLSLCRHNGQSILTAIIYCLFLECSEVSTSLCCWGSCSHQWHHREPWQRLQALERAVMTGVNSNVSWGKWQYWNQRTVLEQANTPPVNSQHSKTVSCYFSR